VDDGVAAVDGGAERRGVRHVSGRELDPQRRQLRGLPGIAHQRAHRQVARAQRVGDLGPDEAGRAGDEDHSKFFQ
jgi:hypothetical protein